MKHLIPLVILPEQQVVFLVTMNLTVFPRYMNLNHQRIYNQCHAKVGGKVSTYFQLLVVSSRIFQLWILKIILLVVTLRKASFKVFCSFFLANRLTAF